LQYKAEKYKSVSVVLKEMELLSQSRAQPLWQSSPVTPKDKCSQ